MSVCQTPIIVALDYPTRDAALKLADQLDPRLCRVKVGKELFTSCAADIVGTLRDKGFEVFLDLKFHDIPNTTAMAEIGRTHVRTPDTTRTRMPSSA